jgi:hypothetical protein
MTIPLDSDVHVLDGFVESNFGPFMGAAHTLASGLGLNETMSAETIKGILYSCIDNDADSHEHITRVIDRANENADVLSIYSQVVSMIIKNDYRHDLLGILKDSISENITTGGGCLQGVRNRIFIVYCFMAKAAMESKIR